MSEKRNIIGAFIEDKLVPVSTGFAQNPYVRCIGSGSQSLMAIIMLGAIFNLFNSIAWAPYQSLITSLGISGFLSTVYNASMNFMGIFMVFSIAFQSAKIWNHSELSFNNGLLALMCYLILIPYGKTEAGA